MKKSKVSKILSRAKAAPEPIVLSFDLRPRSSVHDDVPAAAPHEAQPPAPPPVAAPLSAPPRAADAQAPPPGAPPAQQQQHASAAIPADVDMMRQQAQRLLADAQAQSARLAQDAQAKMMEAQKYLLDSQSQAQTALMDAQSQAQKVLADAQGKLSCVQQDVEAQTQAMRQEKLKAIEGELQALRQKAQLEGREAGFAEGHREGFTQAVASVNEQAGDLIERLRNVVETTTQVKVQELEKIEGELVSFALEVAEKILHGEVRTNPDTVLSIARGCLKKFAERSGIVLKVNREDLEYIISRKEEFSVLEDLEKLYIQEDPRVGKGGVILETQSGEVDGRIDVQMDKIRETFNGMLQENE